MTQDQAVKWVNEMQTLLYKLILESKPITKEQMESGFKIAALKFMPPTAKVIAADYDIESRMMNTTIQIG